MKLTVNIGRSESEQWNDLEFRSTLVETFRKMARAKGRKYYEIFDEAGRPLQSGAVDA